MCLHTAPLGQSRGSARANMPRMERRVTEGRGVEHPFPLPIPVEGGEGNAPSPTPEPSSIQGNVASWACLAWQPPNPSQPVTNPQGGKREGLEGRGGLASRSEATSTSSAL